MPRWAHMNAPSMPATEGTNTQHPRHDSLDQLCLVVSFYCRGFYEATVNGRNPAPADLVVFLIIY